MSRIKTRSSQYNLKKYLKVNLSDSDILGALLNGRLPAYETYETYRSRLDATRFQVPSANEALCIACIQ